MRACKVARFLPLLIAAASLNAAVPDASTAVRVKGSTVRVASKLHATIVLVRNGGGSGPAEHLFQVWSNPGLDLNGIYQGADVEYNGTSLTVVLPTEKSVTSFTVKGYASPAIPTPEGFSSTTYGVLGLSHQIGAAVERLTISTDHPAGRISANECTDCDWLPFEDPWGGTSGAGCNAGGTYSTSCSVTYGGGTCSVSCGPNSYACCKFGPPVSCSCVGF